jgi:hypothetical protein
LAQKAIAVKIIRRFSGFDTAGLWFKRSGGVAHANLVGIADTPIDQRIDRIVYTGDARTHALDPPPALTTPCGPRQSLKRGPHGTMKPLC